MAAGVLTRHLTFFLQEGETQGAMSAVAMALTAIFTAFVGPFLIPWLLVVGQ